MSYANSIKIKQENIEYLKRRISEEKDEKQIAIFEATIEVYKEQIKKLKLHLKNLKNKKGKKGVKNNVNTR